MANIINSQKRTIFSKKVMNDKLYRDSINNAHTANEFIINGKLFSSRNWFMQKRLIVVKNAI